MKRVTKKEKIRRGGENTLFLFLFFFLFFSGFSLRSLRLCGELAFLSVEISQHYPKLLTNFSATRLDLSAYVSQTRPAGIIAAGADERDVANRGTHPASG
jgi:hypothetical protein